MEDKFKREDKTEKRAREKESAYQERLRAWEARESKKAKVNEKERLKEKEWQRDAKRLKEFLEDYDDERDDVKFYKGSQLQTRLADRVKEAEKDERDRQNEKETIEELKAMIFSAGYEDPNAECERAKKERDEQTVQELAATQVEFINSDSAVDDNNSLPPPKPDISSENHSESVKWTQVHTGDDDSQQLITSNSEESAAPPTGTGIKSTLSKPSGLHSPQLNGSKRKAADSEDTCVPVKKLKLVPLDDSKDKKSKRDKENGEKKSDKVFKSQEEKRKRIKSLIDKIPTEKDAVFAYQLDWSIIDNTLMEKKIRPWINKKIIEYIGEPEPLLVNFICSKILARPQPQVLLDDLQMVLDEEAEVFIMKMWKLLIYEVEAKKLGLVK